MSSASPNLPAIFRPGDVVVVRSAAEILETLDARGTRAGLPFMPEMIEHLGKRFVVSRKLEKTCVDGSPEGMREFRDNDVVFLEELRCDGAAHGGCGRACMLFWKAAWIKLAGAEPDAPPDAAEVALLQRRLLTRHDDGRYYCQSSDLDSATQSLGRLGRAWKCVRNVAVGNSSVWGMVKLIVKPMRERILVRLKPRWPSGPSEKTPVETLGLQAGDWVEVKSVEEISATLDPTGKNRGLQFAYDLAWCCGKKFKVRSRLEHMVLERTGKYLDVRNTVLLEGVTCPCRCVIGGCGRADYIYWREIWVRKIPAHDIASIPDTEKGQPPACGSKRGRGVTETAGCC